MAKRYKYKCQGLVKLLALHKPNAYYKVAVWQSGKMVEGYSLQARGYASAKRKAVNLSGPNVSVTRNFKLQSELL
jgi:hypothetical protein